MAYGGGSSRPYLIHVVDRYGPQIEADLHREFAGLDLLDFFRGKHPWGKLRRLLGQLPANSKYIVAQRADEEYVAQLAAQGVDLSATGGEMTEDGYGTVEVRLDNLTDAVMHLQHTLVAVNGGKPGPFKGVKRPTNAIQKHLEKARVGRHEQLLDEVAAARERRKKRAG